MRFVSGLTLLYLLAVNLFGFIVCGTDKHRAREGRWRIRERTIILIAVIGGSVGVLVGMHIFHHKTRHKKFSVGVPLILCLQIALAIGIIVQIVSQSTSVGQ